MSRLTPPSISSDAGAAAPAPDSTAADAEQDAAEGLRTLVGRLAEEFGADGAVIASVASILEDVRVRAPDLFVPAAGGLGAAFAQVASGGAEAVYVAVGEWGLDAEGEPIERMRRDCLRFQSAMTRGVLRLYAGDPERCADGLLALQRFVFLQLALLASLAARSQEGGGVVRTLPTPEYAAFMEIFRTAIDAHRQEGRQLGLLLIHVARVEQVDRLLGLQRGEAFMLRVTRRMREGVLRKQDQLGRVSRDQLACLLPRIAGEGVAVLAANKILGALEAPIPIGERTFAPDVAIGIAMYPDHGADAQTLVRNGKLAAQATRTGSERVGVYDRAHGESEERNVQYEGRLRRALEDNAFELAYAPQLDLQTGRIAGLECILRWTDPVLGEVPEARALEAAESAGLTRELTWWMFNNALRQYAEMTRAGIEQTVGVKIAASAFAQPDFTEFVERALRTWKVPPGRLAIELHETALSGGIEPVKDALEQLKALGLRLGIDGFGTGSCSLTNLAQLPLDEVKVGVAFLTDLRQATLHVKVVRSLTHLAQDLGLLVTADGVEDEGTALALSTLGCERVQGAYVGAPLSAQEVVASGIDAEEPVELPLRAPAQPGPG